MNELQKDLFMKFLTAAIQGGRLPETMDSKTALCVECYTMAVFAISWLDAPLAPCNERNETVAA